MKVSQRFTAILVGVSLLIMALTAFWGMQSLELLKANAPGALVQAIIGWSIILVTDLLVSWGLYRFFREESKGMAEVMGALRLVYSIALGIGIVMMWVRGGAAGATAFEHFWSGGLIVFGLHLLVLGWMIISQNKVPKWLGWTILPAGLGYILVHGGGLAGEAFAPVIQVIEMIFMLPMIVGEVGLAIWMIWKGGREEEVRISAKSVSECG